jgi:hypothetical protein
VSAMFGRRPARPDPALLARVSDDHDVDLGSYAEAALAVTGAYPARGGLDPRPQGTSSFRRLDGAARRAAMQAALDRMTGDGTLTLAPGEELKDVVAAGLDGKLALAGQLGDLYRLCFWFRRRGLLSGMVVSMAVSDSVQGAAMQREVPPARPDAAPPPGAENCYAVPSDNRDDVLLVERPDDEAGTRRYALRTLRGELGRMAEFLFAGPVPEGQARRADADMWFRFRQRTLKVENGFIRPGGEDVVMGRILVEADRKKREPRFIQVDRDQMVDGLVANYRKTAARTL